MKLTAEEFERFRIPFNNVLIKLHQDNDRIKFDSGVELMIDITYNPEKHTQTTGIVTKLPSRLVYNPTISGTLPWDTNMELEIGDEVVCYYLATVNAVQQGSYCEVHGEIYIYVPYDQIFVAKRVIPEGDATVGDHFITEDGKWKKVIMLNGFILCTPISDDYFEQALSKLKLVLPDSLLGRKDGKKAIVKFIGSSNRGYMHDEVSCDCDDVVPGDIIIFDKHCDIPLQYEMHKSFDNKQEYFRIQRRYVMAIVREKKP